MIPLDFHTFRDWDAQALRFVRFNGSEVPTDARTERTSPPAKAPEPAERAAEASGGDSADSGALQAEIDAKIIELNDYLNTLTDHLDSLNTHRYDEHTPNLPREHPFYHIDDPKILAEGAQLLAQAIDELSTSCIDDVDQALSDFHDSLGPIRNDLKEALATSFSITSSDIPTDRPAVTSSTESVAETGAGSNYTVRSGDTMYGILTKQLANDALRSKVTTRYGLSPDLALKDLVLQLFAHTDKEPLNDRLKQDLIYPGDRVFFNESGSIQYFRQTSESPTPAPPAPAGDAGASDAVVATDIDSDGDGLAQLDDEVPAEEGEGERDRNPEADQTDVIRGLDVEPEPPLPIGSSPETSQERQLREDFYAFFKDEWEKTRSTLPEPYSSYEVEQLISSVDVDETSPHGKGTFTLDGPLWLAMIQNSSPIEGYSAEDLSALTVETLPNYLNTEFHALVDRFEVEFSGRHPELSVSFDNLYTFKSDPSDPSKIIMTINFDSVFDSAAGAEPTPAAASEDLEPTITDSEKLGDLTVNYGEGVHELLYRYGIADGKLQFNESSPKVYSLDPDTFPKGTACVTDAVMLAPQYLSPLNITSTEFKTLTITKVADKQLRIEGSSSDGKSSISFLVHLPKLIEKRREQTVVAALGKFSEAEINPEDIQIISDHDPEDHNLDRVSIHLDKVVIRGRIYGGFNAKASAPDFNQARQEALNDIHNQVKTLYEKTIKDQHEATLAILPADFPALKEYIQQHPEIYDLSFEQHSLAGDENDTVGMEMKLSFKIHGILIDLPISKERGPNLPEAIRRAQSALMETLTKYDTGPLEGDHPRMVAPSTAEGAVDTRKIEKIPVSDAEQYAYFREHITKNPDGSITFQFYHPLSERNHQIPCTGHLHTNGTLTLEGTEGLNVKFRLSYTALFNNQEKEQPLHAVRFGDTVSAAANRQGQPWLQQLTDDRTGRVTGMDMIITDDLLYKIVRDALSKKVPQPGGPDYAAPETFSRRYQAANDFSDVQKHLPAYQRLPIQGNFLWVKPIERKP